MEPQKEQLIRKALERSYEALDNAASNFETGYFIGACNRIYYAIFYSVKALAYLKEFETVTHIELMYWFNTNFIEENNVFDENLYFVYLKSFEIRLKYDYDLTAVPIPEEVTGNLEEARLFVGTVSDYIKGEHD